MAMGFFLILTRDEAARGLYLEGARGDSGHIPTGCARGWAPWGMQWYLPTALAGDSLFSSDFTYKGPSSSMILRVLLYLLRYFLPSEVADCWSHWFLWTIYVNEFSSFRHQGLHFTGNLDLTEFVFKRPWNDLGPAKLEKLVSLWYLQITFQISCLWVTNELLSHPSDKASRGEECYKKFPLLIPQSLSWQSFF